MREKNLHQNRTQYTVLYKFSVFILYSLIILKNGIDPDDHIQEASLIISIIIIEIYIAPFPFIKRSKALDIVIKHALIMTVPPILYPSIYHSYNLTYPTWLCYRGNVRHSFTSSTSSNTSMNENITLDTRVSAISATRQFPSSLTLPFPICLFWPPA